MAELETCRFCGAASVDTRNSRPSPLGRLRRKACRECGKRWSTREVAVSLFIGRGTDRGILLAAMEEIRQQLGRIEGVADRLRAEELEEEEIDAGDAT